MNAILPNELIIDNFAGGGGASLGLELALGRVDVAINHDPIAVAMHAANHPRTHHYTQSITAVDKTTWVGGHLRQEWLIWLKSWPRLERKFHGT